MVRSFLTPGFRFHPTDVELVMYFLKRKVVGRSFPIEAISEIDLYEFDPWDLPGKSCLQSNDLEWYFFCPRARKYANGLKANRTTINGFWKATGEDKPVCYNLETVGWRKTLVFHKGKAPRGHRTDWVMHEYRLEVKDLVGARFSQDAYVVCKIFQKGGRGPRNGEQYGAPFNEADYDDEVEGNPLVLFLLAHPSTSSAVPAADQNISMITSTTGAKEACGLSLEPVPLANLSSAVPAEDQNISMITNTTDPKEACNLSLEVVSRHNVDSDPGEEYFDINELLLDLSNHDAAAALVSDGNGKDEEPDSCILPKSAIKDATGQDGCDIYEGLEDITPQVALEVDYGSFLELNDLTRIMEADGFEYNLSSDLFPFNGNNGSLEDFHGSPIPLDTVLPACEENWSRSIPLPDRSGFSGDQLAAVSEIGDFGGNSSWHCQAAPDSLSHSRKRRKK